MDGQILTEDKFDQLLRQWAHKVKVIGEGKLVVGTHGTGKLLASLANYVDKMRDEIGRHLSYRFEQYGVFRTYGAGRGWVVINGHPTPGHRVVSLKQLRTKSWRSLDEVKYMRRRGFLDRDIRNAKIRDDRQPKKQRVPLDWLDGSINEHFDELASIAQQFYGDKALQSLANSISKAKINKHGS